MRRIVASLELPSPGGRDYLTFDLYANRGVFVGSDIEPGTYALQGAETRYSTCGACVIISTNEHAYGSSGIDYDEQYVAQSGTLILTDTNGRLAGSLTDVELAHFTHEPVSPPSDTIADGCTTKIPSLEFDIPL